MELVIEQCDNVNEVAWACFMLGRFYGKSDENDEMPKKGWTNEL